MKLPRQESAWALLLLVAGVWPVRGDDAVRVEGRLAPEVSVIGVYSDRDGWESPMAPLSRNGLGGEYFGTFSGPRGDFMRANLQLRVVHDDRDETDSDLALELHNAWLRWSMGLGKYLRAGHFSPAYGLEPVTDTHGTLLQTLAMQDVGMKHDWGIGVEGFVGPLDYRTAVQLGSGMGFGREDKSHLVSARVGSPESRAIRWGLSLLHGRTLVGADRRLIPTPRYAESAIRRSRIGVDLRAPLGPLASSVELSWGENDSEEAWGALGEARLESVAGTHLSLAAQARYWSEHRARGDLDRSQGAAVLALPMSDASTIRLGFFSDISSMGAEPRDRMVVVQFYHVGS